MKYKKSRIKNENKLKEYLKKNEKEKAIHKGGKDRR